MPAVGKRIEIQWKYTRNKPSPLGEIIISIPIKFKITRRKYSGNIPSPPRRTGRLGEIVSNTY